MLFGFTAGLLAALAGTIDAASTFSPARPPAVPLAVRSPYLSTWLKAGSALPNGGELSSGSWPVHWADQITGWTGLIRVDGKTYTWMGNPVPANTPVTQVSLDYTSTKSTFVMKVEEKVEMTVTFLSPVYANDLKRQSLVFSYYSVDVRSIDGASHDVQLYSDISAEWVSGDGASVAQWDYGVAENVAYYKVFKQTPALFSEQRDQAEWGNWYFATDNVDSLTYQSGSDLDVRAAFTRDGKLGDIKDPNFRAINEDWPTFGFAVSFAQVGLEVVGTLFSIGLCQEEAVQFASANGYGPVPSLWKSFFTDDLAALTFFHKDFGTAETDMAAFDQKIADDSIAAAGENYLTLTSLATRQAFAATQLVGTEAKPYMFMKEISSNGNVQTVDVVFPLHPIVLYSNPMLLKILLDPHFEIQESGQYPNKSAMHDIGARYPNATGHPDGQDEPMPVEECGNMLIMVLAYAQRANDNDYLSEHYDILKQWNEFLITKALLPEEQLSTDDFAGPLVNQTNLALKGIVGIEAMSQIAKRTGHDEDAQNFTNIAHDYITKWQGYGFNREADPPHATLNYNNQSTWGLLYNLFGDRELGLNLVPQEIYDDQSAFYPTVRRTYGIPLDTRHNYTKADWELFVAAVSSETTRDLIIGDLAKWVEETPTSRPFTDWYETENGDFPGLAFSARPVIGGLFSLLVL